jgi:tRNA (mo5U34)-methyltransferase
MNAQEIQEEISKVKWFHTLDLGHGIITPGQDDSFAKLKQLRLPEDLTGRTVLDIGAYDGFFSFEAEKRGAKRVLAVDLYAGSERGGGRKAGFNLAKRILGSKVEEAEIDVADMTPERVGSFDVVLFLGVLYHLKDPLSALERVASVTKGLLILETHADLLHMDEAAVAYYPGTELNDDMSNWCGPNHAALSWMLKEAGFKDVKPVYQTPGATRARSAVRLALKGKTGFLRTYRQARVVYHAHK